MWKSKNYNRTNQITPPNSHQSKAADYRRVCWGFLYELPIRYCSGPGCVWDWLVVGDPGWYQIGWHFYLHCCEPTQSCSSWPDILYSNMSTTSELNLSDWCLRVEGPSGTLKADTPWKGWEGASEWLRQYHWGSWALLAKLKAKELSTYSVFLSLLALI